jgi:hypothetical protein
MVLITITIARMSWKEALVHSHGLWESLTKLHLVIPWESNTELITLFLIIMDPKSKRYSCWILNVLQKVNYWLESRFLTLNHGSKVIRPGQSYDMIQLKTWIMSWVSLYRYYFKIYLKKHLKKIKKTSYKGTRSIKSHNNQVWHS